MRVSRFCLFLFTAQLALALGGVCAAQSPLHRDSELGFQVRAPSKWRKVKLHSSEKYVVARYNSPRDYVDRKEGYMHRPEMSVILFPRTTQKATSAKVKDRGDGKITIQTSKAYKNFDDYLKDHARGGYYKIEDKKTVVNGIDVTCLKYRFEKLTAKRIAVAWIFHGKDAEWVCYYEGLESYMKKLLPLFVRSGKTFKFIKRTGSLDRGGATGEQITIEMGDAADGKKSKNDMTPAELLSDRQKKFDRLLARESAEMPKGWKKVTSKNFVVLTHVDRKYTNHVIKQCEAVRAWLDEQFSWVGTGIPGRGLIKIYRTYDDSSAARGIGIVLGSSFEITTYKQGSFGFGTSFLNTRILSMWFRDKNKDLAWSMPAWLGSGLDQVVGTAVVKGRKLKLVPDRWEITSLRQLAKQEKIVMPRDFVKSEWKEFAKVDGASYQAGAFVRFLLVSPKSRTNDALRIYMEAILSVAEREKAKEKAEEQKKAGSAVSKRKLTEEEQEELEAEQYKQRKQKGKKRLAEIFRSAFDGWDEKKWKKFDRAYRSFLK